MSPAGDLVDAAGPVPATKFAVSQWRDEAGEREHVA